MAYYYTQCSVVRVILRTWARQKPLSRSRCHLGWWLGWAHGTMCEMGAPISPGEGAIFCGQIWSSDDLIRFRRWRSQQAVVCEWCCCDSQEERVRVTLLSRSTQYRRILNENEVCVLLFYGIPTGPWKSVNFLFHFRAWKVLENRWGLWKSLNFIF